MEGIVLRLLSDRRNEIVLLGDVGRLLDLLSGPLRSTPVVGHVHVNGLGESLNNFLHRNTKQMLATMRSAMRFNLLWVVAVSKDNVDVWCLEPSERALETLNDVLLRQTSTIS
jgi:hypothetical protein